MTAGEERSSQGGGKGQNAEFSHLCRAALARVCETRHDDGFVGLMEKVRRERTKTATMSGSGRLRLTDSERQ
jgi:hypothetical protein